jgi:hypothetical protein
MALNCRSAGSSASVRISCGWYYMQVEAMAELTAPAAEPDPAQIPPQAA